MSWVAWRSGPTYGVTLDVLVPAGARPIATRPTQGAAFQALADYRERAEREAGEDKRQEELPL